MDKKIDVNSIKIQNKRLILKEIIKKRLISRNSIASELGLSVVTVAKILQEIMDSDIIEEVRDVNSTIGRKANLLQFVAEARKMVAIDLASRHFSYSIIGLGLDVESTYFHVYKENMSYESNLHDFLSETRDYILRNDLESKIVGIGVSVPGAYNKSEDRVTCTKIPELPKIKLKEAFSQYFKMNIIVEQDIRLMVMHDTQYMEYSFKQNIFYIYVGEGTGGAILIDGNIFCGAKDLAGEVGQMLIEGHKSLDDLISWEKFISAVKDHYSDINCKDLSDMNEYLKSKYDQEDAFITEEINRVAEVFSHAIMNIMCLLDPNIIIISGNYNIFGNKFVELLREYSARFVLPEVLADLKIQLSENGGKGAVLGLGYLLREKWMDSLTQPNSAYIRSDVV